MSCTNGLLRSRYGWQRPRAIGACATGFFLVVCGACAPSPRSVYRNAESLRRGDRLEEAIQLADRGLVLSHGSPEWFHRFRVLKAELLVMEGLPKQALALLDSPISIPVPNQPELKGEYLYARGYALAYLPRNQEAKALLEEARDIAAAAHLDSLQSTVLVRLGTVLLSLGESAKGEESYKSALAKANAARDSYLQARAQEALGYLALNSFRNDECATWNGLALHTYQTLGAEIRIASVSDNLGWCDYRLGNQVEAQVLFTSAQKLFTKHKQWGALGINLNANGTAAIARGDYPAARSDYEQVIELATKYGTPQTVAEGRTNLATTLILMGDIDAAEAANQQALSIPEDRVSHEIRLRMELNSGRIEAARGHLEKAESFCRRVINSDIRQPKLVIDAEVLLAKLLDREGRPRDAETELQRALTYLDDSRAKLLRDESKLTYIASLMQTFREYVNLLCRQNRPSDALEIAESSRARLLFERSSVEKTSPTAAAFQELARKTGTVFLFYWVAPGQSRLWVVTAAGITTAVLPADTEIRSRVESYSRFIENFGDPLSEANPGRELFATLVGPVQNLVPANSHVVIVPDGPLFDVNFESLPVPGGRPHYWLQDVTVSVAPSLSLLLRQSPEPSPRPENASHTPAPRLLLIGDALSSGQPEFPHLANARREMDGIRMDFPPGASVLRTGADATPQSYAAAGPANFSIIHFAAHATANLNSPLDSAVILTPSRGNYKLYAREIRNHPISADLVTISACSSAGPRMYGGEGLVGFVWAFLGAGARNVVAGLWDVNDSSTPQLMDIMYRQLQHGAPPAEALRQAKLALATSTNKFRKPYYWAPFELFTVSLN
jgi:CHAT domain-containing protein